MSPPSSPDSVGGLLAAARRRLPADVDVVGLAGGLLAGAVALTGCGASPDEVRAETAGSRSHVLDVSRGVLGDLVALGTFREPTTGCWSGCDDFGGKVAYHVTGRMDPPPDVEGALAERVVAALAPSGWRLRPVYPGRDDPVTLEAVRDEVNVQFSGYRSQRFVLFDISGPCLDVGDLDDEFLAEEAEILTFG